MHMGIASGVVSSLLRRQWKNLKAIDGDFGHFCCQWTFFKAIDDTLERVEIDGTVGEGAVGATVSWAKRSSQHMAGVETMPWGGRGEGSIPRRGTSTAP